jgi:hypothetical protein
MKYLSLLCLAALAISSCSSPDSKQARTDTAATSLVAKPAEDTASALCFLLTEGQTGQDTTSIELVIEGDSVTGVMNWMPYEKDARKGKLKGIKSGDEIKATWSFMQEGMTDTIGLHFKLAGDKLTQKPLKFNEKSGRQQTDASAGYRLTYQSHNKVYK